MDNSSGSNHQDETSYRDIILIVGGILFAVVIPIAVYKRWHQGQRNKLLNNTIIISHDFYKMQKMLRSLKLPSNKLKQLNKDKHYFTRGPRYHTDNKTFHNITDSEKYAKVYMYNGELDVITNWSYWDIYIHQDIISSGKEDILKIAVLGILLSLIPAFIINKTEKHTGIIDGILANAIIGLGAIIAITMFKICEIAKKLAICCVYKIANKYYEKKQNPLTNDDQEAQQSVKAALQEANSNVVQKIKTALKAHGISKEDADAGAKPDYLDLKHIINLHTAHIKNIIDINDIKDIKNIKDNKDKKDIKDNKDKKEWLVCQMTTALYAVEDIIKGVPTPYEQFVIELANKQYSPIINSFLKAKLELNKEKLKLNEEKLKSNIENEENEELNKENKEYKKLVNACNWPSISVTVDNFKNKVNELSGLSLEVISAYIDNWNKQDIKHKALRVAHAILYVVEQDKTVSEMLKDDRTVSEMLKDDKTVSEMLKDECKLRNDNNCHVMKWKQNYDKLDNATAEYEKIYGIIFNRNKNKNEENKQLFRKSLINRNSFRTFLTKNIDSLKKIIEDDKKYYIQDEIEEAYNGTIDENLLTKIMRKHNMIYTKEDDKIKENELYDFNKMHDEIYELVMKTHNDTNNKEWELFGDNTLGIQLWDHP